MNLKTPYILSYIGNSAVGTDDWCSSLRGTKQSHTSNSLRLLRAKSPRNDETKRRLYKKKI